MKRKKKNKDKVKSVIYVEEWEYQGRTYYTAYDISYGKFLCYGTGKNPVEALVKFAFQWEDFKQLIGRGTRG